jgi:hypothetical protein
LQVSAVALFAQWPFAEGLGDSQRTAILLAPVYVALFLMSAAASRRAGRIVERAGSEARAGVWCWGVFAALFLALLPATIFSMSALVIVLFVALHVLHDAWRPILVGRFDVHSGQAEGATIMSLESQARSLATMVVAPLLGASVDALTAPGQPEVLWPVAALGAAVGVASFFRASRVARVQSE